MNAQIVKVAAILIITMAVLFWLRSDGRYDFDIRSIIPFMRGEATLHDWGGLCLIGLGLWGLGRLRRGRTSTAEASSDDDDSYEDGDADDDGADDDER